MPGAAISFSLLCVLAISTIAFSSSSFNAVIPSSGQITLAGGFSQLHIGNSSIGENPCYFYNENGTLTTLRITWEGDMMYPSYDIPDAEQQLQINKNVSGNCERFLLYPSAFFPNPKGTVDTANISAVVNLLRCVAGNGSYYILSWDFFLGGDNNNWFSREMNASSIFWNTTVQNDLIWMTTTLFSYINAVKVDGQSLLSYMAYISFTEWLDYGGIMTNQNSYSVTGTDLQWQTNARNPYRFSGDPSFYMGEYNGNHPVDPPYNGGTQVTYSATCAEVSWTNWLKKKYNDNITALKIAWNVTDMYGAYNDKAMEYWNYTGTESNSFSNLTMGNMSYNTGRELDFGEWYDQCTYNFTMNFKNSVKAFYPNVYFAVDTMAPLYTPSHTAGDCGCSPLILAETSDLLDYHLYGGWSGASTADTVWFQGDVYHSWWCDIGAFGRAMNKPVVVDECGASALAWYEPWQYWEIGFLNVSVSLAISNGIAGVGWYWLGIRWYGYNAAIETRAGQALQKYAISTYANASAYLGNVQYDKIAFIRSLADFAPNMIPSISTATDSGKEIMWLQQAGYNPDYLIFGYNETSFVPSIPADTQVIIYDSSYYGNQFIPDSTASALNTFLANGGKLVISYARMGGSAEWAGFNEKWESQINAAYFPISPAVYGSSYTTVSNSTNVSISVYGQTVFINRSADYSARFTIKWTDADITGSRLINMTDGVAQGGNPQPFCIANSHVAWIASPIFDIAGWFPTSSGEGGMLTSGYGMYLVYEKILSFWGTFPRVNVGTDKSLTMTAWTASVTSANNAKIAVSNFNFTRGQSTTAFTFSLNVATLGLNKSATYFMFWLYNGTTFTKTGDQLGSAMQLELPANQTSTIILMGH
jgi:hypothetical protein